MDLPKMDVEGAGVRRSSRILRSQISQAQREEEQIVQAVSIIIIGNKTTVESKHQLKILITRPVVYFDRFAKKHVDYS